MSSDRHVSALDTGILLDAGTNELEVLVFMVGTQPFGVNVAKVREVLALTNVISVPGSHEAIDGVVRIREMVVSVVDLQKYLFGAERQSLAESSGERLLLLEFNDEVVAFRVQDIERIYRLSWKEVIPMPTVEGLKAPVTGVVNLQNRLVPMLDFESIGVAIGMNCDVQETNREPVPATNQSETPIVFADDSPLIREMLQDELTTAGFSNVRGFSDGQDAWEYLSQLADHSTPETIAQQVGLLVTDVEMPRLDGLSLTRKVRSHPALQKVPVVVFSSIASQDNKKKAIQVGATTQVAKPKYRELTETLTRILAEAQA